MAIVVPTITAENAHVYREQVERVEPFAERIHVDIMDGKFTPNTGVSVDTLWWPEATEVDVHVMFQAPESILDKLIELRPSLVIIPAESDCNHTLVAQKLRNSNIRAGLALLPETTVASVKESLNAFDHILIFSGNLGHQGGSVVDLGLLEKVAGIRAAKTSVEIGWDGGVSDKNIKKLVDAGVEVVNSGGFIHYAQAPEAAYRQLVEAL